MARLGSCRRRWQPAMCSVWAPGACSPEMSRWASPPQLTSVALPMWEEKPSERKHPSTRRKRNQEGIPKVAASKMGRDQTEPWQETVRGCGVIGPSRFLAFKVLEAWNDRQNRSTDH